MQTIIGFGLGFLAGALTCAWYVWLNNHIDAQDWGEPDPDPHEEIDYADIPAFLRRQAD